MYATGDRVMYPMHGAGIVQNIEEKLIDGNPASYYVLNLPLGNMTVTVSTTKTEKLGIRPIISEEECATTLDNPEIILDAIPDNWTKRYEYNLAKLKSGKLSEAIEVYICLFTRERQKGLSGMEKKLLSTAKNVISSEIMVCYGIDRIKAEDFLRVIVDKHDQSKGQAAQAV